jgi:hypothetical protein
VLDRSLKRRQHLFRELAGTIDGTASGALSQLVADAVVQVGPPAVLAAGFDSYESLISHIGLAKVF